METCSTSIKGLKWVYTSASCQGSKGADIGDMYNCKQTSGLTYTMQTSMARKILPWMMWLCSEEHTFAKLFEELY